MTRAPGTPWWDDGTPSLPAMHAIIAHMHDDDPMWVDIVQSVVDRQRRLWRGRDPDRLAFGVAIDKQGRELMPEVTLRSDDETDVDETGRWLYRAAACSALNEINYWDDVRRAARNAT